MGGIVRNYHEFEYENHIFLSCCDNNIMADFVKYQVKLPTEQERVLLWENEVNQ